MKTGTLNNIRINALDYPSFVVTASLIAMFGFTLEIFSQGPALAFSGIIFSPETFFMAASL